MAKEGRVLEVIEELGFTPEEDRNIIVKYRSDNLAGKIEDFFSGDFYILQICENEIILLKVLKGMLGFKTNLKKEKISLAIPKDEIEKVDVTEGQFNYDIDIYTRNSVIKLTAQVKGLSSLRTSGSLSIESFFKGTTWHGENVDETVKELKTIKNQ
ncbi:MAG: hypothetical protein WAO56_03480 [Miniphocaeibacter sp.]|uniref:hypothetical protein n=1 Tax=Miniphocaeibacter sp. TaxID=3100973 RepID=UPI00183F917C|nr:hypothetical protein [Gallicola sp.]